MKAALFLAKKGITGDKKRSAFLITIISIVLFMSIVITIVQENIQHLSATSSQLSGMVTLMLLVVLFAVVFVSVNLVVNNNRKLYGIYAALGMKENQIRCSVVVQTLIITLLAVPIGVLLGIGGSWFLLHLSLEQLIGSVLLPAGNIVICIVACIIAVFGAAIYPAYKAGQVSPVVAMSDRETVMKNDATTKATAVLLKSNSKMSFAVRYGLRTVFENRMRVSTFILVIGFLLTIYIQLSSSVAVMLKEGNGRQERAADYVIGMPPGPIGENQHIISEDMLNAVSGMEGVCDVYCQYSVLDRMLGKTEGYYDYYFKVDTAQLTEQAIKQLTLSAPMVREGYPGVSFIHAGLSGYTEKELQIAIDHLIEGTVTVEQMKNENMILLPKYIEWFENIDIPYSNLKVGDQITLVENQAESVEKIDVVNEYTYTIGGFVDTPPFPQVNGVSSGFVGIVHYSHIEALQTKGKGLVELYVNGDFNQETLSALEQLCQENGLALTDTANNVAAQEAEYRQSLLITSAYSVFFILGTVIFLTIFNVFLSNIIMRRGEFTLLYVIGVRKWQRAWMIVTEVRSFIIPGIVVGCGMGIAFIVADSEEQVLSIGQLIPLGHIFVGIFIIALAAILGTVIGIRYLNRNCIPTWQMM